MAIRRQKLARQYVIDFVTKDDNGDDSSVGGMSSGEEEELNNQLMNDERYVFFQILFLELFLIVCADFSLKFSYFLRSLQQI